jgi:hypothetical protein
MKKDNLKLGLLLGFLAPVIVFMEVQTLYVE